MRRYGLVTLLIVGLLMAGFVGAFDGAESGAGNLAFQLRGPQAPRNEIVIVAIDDASFDYTGLRWPWPRGYFAQLVDRLAASDPAAIGFDVYFFEREASLVQTLPTLVRGETVAEIAAAYGVAEDALRAANDLAPDAYACHGTSLIIPTEPPVRHVVRGDTINSLTRGYVSLEAERLVGAIAINDTCQLRAGMTFERISLNVSNERVRPGETIETLAARLGVRPDVLRDGNDAPLREPLEAGASVRVWTGGDIVFASAIRAAENVVLSGDLAINDSAVGTSVTLRQPTSVLRDAAADVGLTTIAYERDGVVRAVPLAIRSDDVTYTGWPLAVAQAARGTVSQLQSGGLVFGGQTVPLERGWLRLNYRGPAGSFPTYSAFQVVNGDIPASTFRGKIVLIGATSISLQDVHPTPFGLGRTTPGVEIMATAIDNVLAGDSLQRFNGVCRTPSDQAGWIQTCSLIDRWPVAAAVAVAGAVVIGLMRIRRPTLALVGTLVVLASWVAVWYAAFYFGRIELPLVVPGVLLLGGFLVTVSDRAMSEELERRRVRNLFEMFIAPEMARQLIEQGVDAMRGRRSTLTILFSDIRGFTQMSEGMQPEELVAVLNEYLGVMTDVILRHGGTVDKFEGDLVMAFFGAPVWYDDHALRAVRCAIDMRRELERLRLKWSHEGQPLALEMGVGLNTADVFVGLIGSGRRVNYTVMGDGVNLAARTQDLTKDVGWPVLITESTQAAVAGHFDLTSAGRRTVKGKRQLIEFFRVIGEVGAAPGEQVRPLDIHIEVPVGIPEQAA
jgi:adenylate cyclase